MFCFVALQFATLFGMPDDVDLPFANPAPTPALPADTPMTPDTYFDLRDDLVASKQKWLDDISSRNSAVEKAKDEGNTAFRAGEFDKAVLAYTRAIDRSGTVNVPIAPLHVLYGNRSAAHLKLSNPEASLGDAAMAVELAPLWSKAHFRVACALKALGRYAEAKAALRTLLESHPENNTALRELKELERLEPDGGTPVKVRVAEPGIVVGAEAEAEAVPVPMPEAVPVLVAEAVSTPAPAPAPAPAPVSALVLVPVSAPVLVPVPLSLFLSFHQRSAHFLVCIAHRRVVCSGYTRPRH